MFCIKCGYKLSENDVFCPECGEKVFKNPEGITENKTETSTLANKTILTNRKYDIRTFEWKKLLQGNKSVYKLVALLMALLIVVVISLTAGTQKCANGCGEKADPKCWAEMCDDCCQYWSGINGCRTDHR